MSPVGRRKIPDATPERSKDPISLQGLAGLLQGSKQEACVEQGSGSDRESIPRQEGSEMATTENECRFAARVGEGQL